MAIADKTKQIYLFFLIGVLLSACGHNKNVDVSNINVSVKIERFDKDFDQLLTRPMAPQVDLLQKKYGPFYRDFIAMLLQDNGSNIKDTAYFKTLRQVFANKGYGALKHDVDSVYTELSKPEQALTEAFKHLKYYYPEKKLPRVIAFYSGFQAQIPVGEGYVGIGLDLFLGANSRFYPAITELYPRYMSQHFTRENICPRVVEGIAKEDMFPESDSSKTLLSKMIYNGKILYFMDNILPDVGDTLKIGYTTAQLKWATQFEPKIWSFFLDQDLLYETDYPKIEKYLGPAPFTPGLGEKSESAPKLAVWTGWQIVKKYMEKHSEVTLQQLMADNNAQKILNDSGYHPK
jgi:gliding motility-associated lipoprotein GldB